MTAYHVMVEGAHIDIPAFEVGVTAPEGTRIAGFYVWRVERAGAEVEAREQALGRVAAEWSSGKYAALGVQPSFVVTQVHALSWLESLRAKDTGCVFYPHEQA